ncbi:MAG: hypothetical protein AB7T49_00305 [Oligoflexales bacterium]
MKYLLLMMLVLACGKKNESKNSRDGIETDTEVTTTTNEEGETIVSGTIAISIPEDSIAIGIEDDGSSLALIGKMPSGPAVAVNEEGVTTAIFKDLDVKVFLTEVVGDYLLIGLSEAIRLEDTDEYCWLFAVPVEGGEASCADPEALSVPIDEGYVKLDSEGNLYYITTSEDETQLKSIDIKGNVKVILEESVYDFTLMNNGSVITKSDAGIRVDGKLINAEEVYGVIDETIYYFARPDIYYGIENGGVWDNEHRTYSNGTYASDKFPDVVQYVIPEIFQVGDIGYALDSTQMKLKQIYPTELPAVQIDEYYKEYFQANGKLFARSFDKIVVLDPTTGVSELISDEVISTSMSASVSGDSLVAVTDDGIIEIDTTSLQVTKRSTDKKLKAVKSLKK